MSLKSIWPHILFFLGGAVCLSLFVTVEKLIIAAPLAFRDYVAPCLVGGTTVLLLGLWLQSKRHVAELNAVVRELENSRVQEKEAHRKVEEVYRCTVDDAGMGIYLIQDRMFRYVNREMAGLFGYEPEEIVDKLGPLDLTIAQQREMVAKNLHRSVWGELGRPYELSCQRKDNSVFDAVVWSHRGTYQGRPASVGTLWDITEHKWLEELQAKRDEVLERLTEGAPLEAFLGTLVETVEHINPGMLCSVLLLDKEEKRLRHGAAPSLPKFFNEAIDGIEIGPGVSPCGTAAYTGKRVIVEDIISHPYWVEFRELSRKAGLRTCWSEPIVSSSQEILGTVTMYYREPRRPRPPSLAFMKNASNLAGVGIERERTKEALRVAKDEAERAITSKSRWLRATSHGLRQPMQTMSLVTGVLSKTVKDPYTLRLIDNLSEALNTMESLLSALLDISKLTLGAIKPQMSEVHVGNLLSQLQMQFQRHAQKKGLALRIVPSTATVRSDPALLMRILENLVDNAINYTDAGRILIGCRHRAASLRIEVWDTGVGIPKDQLKTIFAEFYRLDDRARDRSKGLGLGLAIVDHLAHLLAHYVDVQSVPGKGSMFAVEVPRRRADAS